MNDSLDREAVRAIYRKNLPMGLIAVTAMPVGLALVLWFGDAPSQVDPSSASMFRWAFWSVLAADTAVMIWLRQSYAPRAVIKYLRGETSASGPPGATIGTWTIVLWSLPEIFFLLGFVHFMLVGSLLELATFWVAGWLVAGALGPTWRYWEAILDRAEARWDGSPSPLAAAPRDESH